MGGGWGAQPPQHNDDDDDDDDDDNDDDDDDDDDDDNDDDDDDAHAHAVTPSSNTRSYSTLRSVSSWWSLLDSSYPLWLFVQSFKDKLTRGGTGPKPWYYKFTFSSGRPKYWVT